MLYVDDLYLHIKSRGKENYYKSHYHTILAWNRKDIKDGKIPRDKTNPSKEIPVGKSKYRKFFGDDEPTTKSDLRDLRQTEKRSADEIPEEQVIF